MWGATFFVGYAVGHQSSLETRVRDKRRLKKW